MTRDISFVPNARFWRETRNNSREHVEFPGRESGESPIFSKGTPV
jgi:hypothetical protein